MKALIVDDEEDIGWIVSKLLSREGLHTDHVSRITEAKRKIENENYKVFFIDLNLPDGTGFDLMPQIRDKDKDSIVIVISAYDENNEINRAREMGAKAFIKKPFTKSELMRVIHDLC